MVGSPVQSSERAARMNARRLMPIHHSTFHDAAEPVSQPLQRLCAMWAPREIICEGVGEVHLE